MRGSFILATLGMVNYWSAVTANDGLVLRPFPGRSGPVKILVYVHGASIDEKNYITASEAIQNASSLNLWVGLPHFLGNTPNPVTIDSAVTGMVQQIQRLGNLTVSAKDVFVAGHSLGGVFAPAVVNKYGYAGLLEFGSYVTNGLDITTTTFPVLTLGGELDGLTRASRIAVEFEKMLGLATSEHLRKPVIILPGVCHSQFCEGVNVTSFGVHDLEPEVSWGQAHVAIAAVAADFMSLVVDPSGPDSEEASDRLRAGFTYTQALVHGFNAARAREHSAWCRETQLGVVALPSVSGGSYDVSVTVPGNAGSLALSHPSLNGTEGISVVSYPSYNLNPIDVSTVPVAAKSLTCEMMTADALAAARRVSGAGGQPVTPNLCEAANKRALLSAESLVAPATLARFKSRGQALSTVADKTTSTGPTFLSSRLGFDTSTTPVAIQGTALATTTTAHVFPGVYQCVLLSPARAIEWMMVDGLPKLG